MALHVEPEILARYAVFYRLALDRQTEDATALVLDGATAQSVQNALENRPWQAPPRTVLIKNCPALKDLSFLAQLPEVEWVCAWRCTALETLWNMAATPALRGLALTDCPKLHRLDALADAQALEHLMLQQSAWRRERIDSLLPLRGLQGLRTLDLACKGVRDKSRLDFRRLYPRLDALTISPNLRENIITGSEAGR